MYWYIGINIINIFDSNDRGVGIMVFFVRRLYVFIDVKDLVVELGLFRFGL